VNDGHANATDSYGCGIDSTFPCKTNGWAQAHPLPGVTDVNIVDEGTHKGNIIYISSGGDSDGKCGTDVKPCDSFETGLSHLRITAGEKALSLTSEIRLVSPFSPDESGSVTSLVMNCSVRKEMRRLRIEKVSWIVSPFCSSVPLTFDWIVFCVPAPSGQISPYLISVAASLKLSNCHFDISNNSLFSLISLSSGSCELSNSKTIHTHSNITLSSTTTSLFSSSSSPSFTITSSHFSLLSLSTPLFTFSSSPSSLNITTSNLTSITSTTTSPTLFSISSFSFKLHNSSISPSSSSSSSKKQTLKYTPSTQKTLQITSSNLTWWGSKRKGGGVYLDVRNVGL
jgi:hypothetical protein